MVPHSNLPNAKYAPVAMIIAERDEQREICEHLERLADDLIGPIDRNACGILLNRLNNDFQLYQRDEEALFDVLSTHEQPDAYIVKCVELAKLDHKIYESYLFELSEPLTDMAEGRRLGNADAVGYMLRCFFESIRRHMSWEDAVLLDERVGCISDEDAARLEVRLTRNRSLISHHLRLVD